MSSLRLSPALTLRTVTTAELLQADRKTWGTIIDLMHKKRSMDDSLENEKAGVQKGQTQRQRQKPKAKTDGIHT